MSDDAQSQGPDFAQGVPLSEVREDRPLLGRVDDEAVILVRRGDTVRAVGATCTHYSGPLAEGLVAGDTVRCPWHHASFDLTTGAVIDPPALSPLPCWNTEVRDGVVRVTARRERPRPPAPPRNPVSVVVIGAGAAGEAAASALREFGYQGPLTVLGAEGTAPVDRPNLSKDYLAGSAPDDWLPLRSQGYWGEHGIALRPAARVTAIDLRERTLRCADGASLGWDALLLATGCTPVRLDIPGADAAHVHTLRTLADSRAIIAAVEAGARRAVVLGASFIGLEAAASLRARGVAVDVVGPEAHPLERVLATRLAEAVQAAHVAMGTAFHLGRKPSRIDAGSVELDDGSRLAADLVVMGVGVRPDTELARQAGLAVDGGIVVDAMLATSAAGVYAAGDVARFPDPVDGSATRIEHWAVAQAQGRLAARNILGFAEPYRVVPFFWSQHGGMTISYVGHAAGWDAIEEDGDALRGSYLCRYLRRGRVVAAAGIGRDLDSLREHARMQQALATV